MTTPEVRELEQDEAIGVEVERFLQGAAGRRMVERFEVDRAAALEALKDMDPDDARAVRRAQNEVAVVDRVLQRLADMLTEARAAIDRLDQLDTGD